MQQLCLFCDFHPRKSKDYCPGHGFGCRSTETKYKCIIICKCLRTGKCAGFYVCPKLSMEEADRQIEEAKENLFKLEKRQTHLVVFPDKFQ